MKDYEVNYVHQESKTIPDANYTFETSTKPAPCKRSDFIKTQTPPTHKDVLLKTWAQDTEAMAAYLTDLSLDEGMYYFLEIQILDNGRYESYKGTITRTEAVIGWIAYLNSAAEKGANQ